VASVYTNCETALIGDFPGMTILEAGSLSGDSVKELIREPYYLIGEEAYLT
jgi:hypothetical protein